MKIAVIAGINQYAHYPDQSLRGCVTDARNYAALFNCGALLLLDKAATTANIIAAWENAVDRAQSGDHVLLAQSSHGMDAGLCTYDLDEANGNWKPGTYLGYEKIAEICRRARPGVLIEIIIDACHTQNGIRQLGETYGRAKYLRSKNLITVPAQLAKPATLPHVILWAACQPEQTSADAYIDNTAQGAFSAAFLKNYRADRCRSDIIFYSRNWLQAQHYVQTPHLYTGHDLAMEAMGL